MRDLTTGPIASTLLLFALPALGSNVLQSINGSINAVWIGQLVGETGLAATANANLIMFMMFALIFGFGMASTIIIGQSAGKGDWDGVRQGVGTGVTLFFALGVIATVAGWYTAPALLHMLGTPDDVYPQALIYLRVMYLGLPTSLLTVFFSMAMRGAGDSLTPMLLLLPGMVVDIVMNPILISGMGPFPELGIMGAGLATLVANFVSFVVMLAVIYGRDLPIRLRGQEFRYLLPRRELVMIIVSKGIPMGLQMVVMSGSALVMLGLVNREGTDTVAAYGAVNQLWTYIQMPAMAIGMAASAMAAQNIGAGKWDRINRIAIAGVMVNLCLTGVIVAVTLIFDGFLLQLFLPRHPEAIAIAEHIGLLASWAFILMGVTMVLSSITRANGATMVPLIIMVLAYIPGRLGSIYGLQGAIGADAIWWSFPIGGALSLIMTAAYYLQGSWRNIRLLATIEEAEEFVQSEAEPTGRILPNG
ncbi:MATE family efflux transporter [Caenibius tardaugens]|nr:MATE family efflux transporter [Caenibius tardaugens]AZI37029.1 MATE family efflux transporter [Caenibius tardaugens NBRC 16725]